MISENLEKQDAFETESFFVASFTQQTSNRGGSKKDEMERG